MDASSNARYKQAGVDIDAGEALVERIKPLARGTSRVWYRVPSRRAVPEPASDRTVRPDASIRADAAGKTLAHGIEELNHPLVDHVRGRGLLLGVVGMAQSPTYELTRVIASRGSLIKNSLFIPPHREALKV